MPIAAMLCGSYLFGGCGPNVQMIYEGSVRFEHCYRLDLDASIAPSHRRACWRDWLSRHTYGQSGDRLAHARQRLDELSRGNEATLPLLADAGVEKTQVSAPVPMPSNIHSAPPPKAPDVRSALPPAPSASTASKPVLPEVQCASDCQKQWDDCSPGCRDTGVPTAGNNGLRASAAESDAGTPDSKGQKEKCSSCTRAFKACMRRCFR